MIKIQNHTHEGLPKEGPWADEPDKAVWVHPNGLDCMIHRGPSGALCGYVGVPEDHPLFGTSYDEVGVDVHGGLTYSNKCQEGEDPAFGICHVPQPGRPDNVWWFGFDCAHCDDFTPRTDALLRKHGADIDLFPGKEHYRTFAYVEAEVNRLAEQIRAFA